MVLCRELVVHCPELWLTGVISFSRCLRNFTVLCIYQERNFQNSKDVKEKKNIHWTVFKLGWPARSSLFQEKKWGKISSPKDGHVYFSKDSRGLGSSNRGLSRPALVLSQQRCVGRCGRVPVVTEMTWRTPSETGNQNEHICLGSGRNVPVLCLLYIWGLVRDVTQIVVTVPQLGQTRDKTNLREVCFVSPQARVCYHRKGKSWWTLEKAGRTYQQLGSKKQGMFMLSPCSQLKWVFPLQLIHLIWELPQRHACHPRHCQWTGSSKHHSTHQLFF